MVGAGGHPAALRASVLALLTLAGAAPAAQAASYHSPGYHGTSRAPDTRPAPLPPAVRLGTGRAPQVVVDEAGTAHITWSEARGDAPDVVRYCRLKRGAKACDSLLELIPVQDGEGDEARFNDELGIPRVLAVGAELVVLTQRYPNQVTGPDGQVHDRNTYLFPSEDGGTTFEEGTLVGDGPTSGRPAVYGTAAAPRIGLISDAETGGAFFQEIAPARYSAARANLGVDGFGSSLAPSGDSVLAAFTNTQDVVHVRRWSGQGDVLDPATWTDATVPSSTDPRLASGPAGAFLLSRDTTDFRLGVRPVDGSGRPGRRARLADTHDASGATLVEDGSGRLLLAYRVSTADGEVLQVRSSTDARHFTTPQPLLRAPAAAGLPALDLAAASDGGGFAVAQEGTGSAEGPIFAVPFGAQGATRRPGLGNLPGDGLDPGVVSTCRRVQFGEVSIHATEGCLLVSEQGRSVKVAEGTILLNGIEIVPEGGTRIVVDSHERTLDTTGPVRVQMRAPGVPPVVLFHGALHIRLPRGGAGAGAARTARAAAGEGCSGEHLAGFGGPTEVEGFPVGGTLDVYLSGESSCVPVALELPKAFGGVRGDAVLRADNARGLHVDSLHIAVGQALIGPLLLKDLAIDYAAAGDEWNGKATLGLPPQPGGAALKAAVRFAGGAFKEGSLDLTFPFPGIALDPFAASYLRTVSGGFGLDPLFIEAGAKFGVLPLPPDAYTFEVDGKLRVTFASPVTFRFTGDGKLLGFPVADESLLVTTDGLVQAHGQVGIDLTAASVKGGLDAFVDTAHKRFSGKIAGEVCVGVCVDASAVVSTRGIGACIPVGGFGYHWGDPVTAVDVMLIDCDLSDYEETVPAAAAAAAGVPFTVPRGEAVTNLRVTGTGGAPSVVLTSPAGDRIVPSADVTAAGAPAVQVAARTRTFVGLRAPAAGRWTVEAADGSAPIAGVAVAHAVPAPEVSARVGGHGRRRVLRYRASTGDGLRTRFVERSRAGERAIGEARGRRGRLRFTPGPGPGGRREVVALVERRGVPRLERTVATFTAPRPSRPRRVRGLRVRRHGRTVVVRWRRSRGVHAYVVRIDLPGGQHLLHLVSAHHRQLRVRGDTDRGRVRATVTARDAAGRAGRPAHAHSRRSRR